MSPRYLGLKNNLVLSDESIFEIINMCRKIDTGQ
jgi:hypothetical protein